MSSFFWDLKCVRNHKESVMTLLAYEKCCGVFSVRVGTLLLTLTSFLFSLCIIAFDWLAVNWINSGPHANISSTASPLVTYCNTTDFACAWMLPWLDEKYISLWILIPAASVGMIAFVGFVGALFKWSILLIPYCVYRFCWFLLVLMFFLPFLFVELLILIILSYFPVCPYFLVVFTWIVNFFENIILAILASEIFVIIIEFHMMTVSFGGYLEFKSKTRSVDEQPTEVFDGDPSMHLAIKVEKEKTYQTIVQRV